MHKIKTSKDYELRQIGSTRCYTSSKIKYIYDFIAHVSLYFKYDFVCFISLQFTIHPFCLCSDLNKIDQRAFNPMVILSKSIQMINWILILPNPHRITLLFKSRCPNDSKWFYKKDLKDSQQTSLVKISIVIQTLSDSYIFCESKENVLSSFST